jgi:hypothetical protein
MAMRRGANAGRSMAWLVSQHSCPSAYLSVSLPASQLVCLHGAAAGTLGLAAAAVGVLLWRRRQRRRGSTWKAASDDTEKGILAVAGRSDHTPLPSDSSDGGSGGNPLRFGVHGLLF